MYSMYSMYSSWLCDMSAGMILFWRMDGYGRKSRAKREMERSGIGWAGDGVKGSHRGNLFFFVKGDTMVRGREVGR